jgi:hypothetical protein
VTKEVYTASWRVEILMFLTLGRYSIYPSTLRKAEGFYRILSRSSLVKKAFRCTSNFKV